MHLKAQCEIKKKYNIDNDEEAESIVFDRIYQLSLPLFQQMIEKGQLRVSFLDHEKYNLKACNNFYNPSAALMNVHFWIDEFINDVDSDTILFMQDDAVLCHSFDIKPWKEFAYVGGVWPKEANSLHPEPREGMCVGMPIRWKSWTYPLRKWEKYGYPNPNNITLSLTFPDICSGNGEGPIGNGGLSLRSRKWMVNAIRTCPHLKWSGIAHDLNNKNHKKIRDEYACQVHDNLNEDLYFGTVLRGLRAPLPTAFEASLFSLEMLWPEESLQLYGGPITYSAQKKEALALWGKGKESFAFFQGISFDNKYLSMPIGIHKPWWYHPNELLLGTEVSEQCPYLRYIFHIEDSKFLSPSLDVLIEE